MNLISMDKRYTLRDGRDVRVLCVDADNEHFPVIGIVHGYACNFSRDGKWSETMSASGNSVRDLVEQPEEKELWTEIFTVGNIDVRAVYYLSETALQIGVASNRGFYANNYKLIAIKKITYVEGEGIE